MSEQDVAAFERCRNHGAWTCDVSCSWHHSATVKGQDVVPRDDWVCEASVQDGRDPHTKVTEFGRDPDDALSRAIALLERLHSAKAAYDEVMRSAR